MGLVISGWRKVTLGESTVNASHTIEQSKIWKIVGVIYVEDGSDNLGVWMGIFPLQGQTCSGIR